jgi:phosphoglycolate phosphatase-like HAD superfamily hydrolase
MSTIRQVVFDCDGTLLEVEAEVKVYSGIPELLHRLSTLGLRLTVWTGRDRASTLRLLQETGLMRFFDDLRTASEMEPKPHPQGLKELLVNEDPQHCVVIGDSWADMRGAQLFGCHALGAVWNGKAQGETLKEFGAKKLVATPSECYDSILSF